MKITIELDGVPTPTGSTGSGPAKPEVSVGTESGVGAQSFEAQPASAASTTPPPEVLATAAKLGAFNAGPAPTEGELRGASAPNLYHSQGAGPAIHEIASAMSAGSAQSGKPCG